MSENKRAAIVTGTSSGIGYAIADALLELGYQVFGISRTLNDKCRFNTIVCDICDTEKLLVEIDKIRKEYRVEILVNNAGIGFYGLHEELNARKIKQLVRTNFEAPMILTNYLLRELKRNKGWVINISSVTASKTNPHGCAYGATKAGLASFSRSLFEEARKYGVRVVNVEPDMTVTNLYRNADFKASDDVMASLSPEEVAEAVSYILKQREGLVVTDITIRPQLHRLSKKNK